LRGRRCFTPLCISTARATPSKRKIKEKAKRYYGYIQEKVKGVGPSKIFRHYFFAGKQTYQLLCGFEGFHAVEREKEAKKDPEVAKHLKELNDLIEMKKHINELMIEPLLSK